MKYIVFPPSNKLFYLLCLLSFIIFTGCGGNDDATKETGSLAFGIQVLNIENSGSTINQILSDGDFEALAEGGYLTNFDCEQLGVATVTAYIYDSQNNLLITGPSWDCNDRSGELGKIPVGSARQVIIEGRDENGNIVVYGSANIGTMLPNEITDVGIIPVYKYIVSGNTPADDETFSQTDIVIEWDALPGAVRYHLEISESPDFEPLIVDDSSITETRYTHKGVSESTTYYWRVSAIRESGSESSDKIVKFYNIGPKTAYYMDADKDTYGNPEESVRDFTLPLGYTTDNTDCNDDDASVFPGAEEIYDDIDNNCDSFINEGFSAWYMDKDGDNFGNPDVVTYATSQPFGYVSDNTDFDDDDPTRYPGAPELYDQKDNDGDGETDEGYVRWYRDSDNDDYGDAGEVTYAITQPDGYVANDDDCNDNASNIHPGATELCGDGIDQNCNGSDLACTPEPTPVTTYTFYRDNDGDNYGDPNVTTTASSQPEGYVSNNTDCDDSRADVNPGATENLEDDVDNDCDGLINEQNWYVDNDEDGYGNPDTLEVAQYPSGDYNYVHNGDDCDDTNIEIHPGYMTWYEDQDDDGFSSGAEDNASCEQPNGFKSKYDETLEFYWDQQETKQLFIDCDDNDPDYYPGSITWYEDQDNDGYSSGTTDTISCEQPDGYRSEDDEGLARYDSEVGIGDIIEDCDDTDPTIISAGVNENGGCIIAYNLIDEDLEYAIRTKIGIINQQYSTTTMAVADTVPYYTGPITDTQLNNWHMLDLSNLEMEFIENDGFNVENAVSSISQLTTLEGLQHFWNIYYLALSNGLITTDETGNPVYVDISAVLSNMPQLIGLNLSGNRIDNLDFLADLPDLLILSLNEIELNQTTIPEGLSGEGILSSLQLLYLGSNGLTNVDFFTSLTSLNNLDFLFLGGNPIINLNGLIRDTTPPSVFGTVEYGTDQLIITSCDEQINNSELSPVLDQLTAWGVTVFVECEGNIVVYEPVYEQALY